MVSLRNQIQYEIELTWATFEALGVSLIGVYFPSGTANPPLEDPSTNSIGGSNDLKSCGGLYCGDSSAVVCVEKDGGWWGAATNMLPCGEVSRLRRDKLAFKRLLASRVRK